MNSIQELSAGPRILLSIASLMIIIAGLRTAESILVPFILSAFIATIAATPLFWLQRKGMPTALALLTVIGMIVIGGSGLGALISSTIAEFTQSIPFYEQRLTVLGERGLALLDGYGITISREVVLGNFDPGFAMRMVGSMMSGLTGALSNTFLILLTTIFILLEARSFPRKLAEVLDEPEVAMPRFASFTETMNSYMAMKTTFSLATGLLVYIINLVLGVDFAILWGVTAFMLNYVPNIGSIIAALPAVLLASVQLGLSEAALLAAGYFAINTVIGSAIEPRFMGKGLGLSTLVVWLSLVFWGWTLGPVGMLLSVPLTVTLRIALENKPDTHWIAVLLGPEDDAPPPPDEVPEHEDAETAAAAEAIPDPAPATN